MPIFNFVSHFFWPRPSNNFKAKILHSSSLFVLAGLFLLVQIWINFTPHYGPKVLGYAANISVEEVIRLTNERRVTAGKSSLVHNPTLSKAAVLKGQDMLEKDYWAHIAPDGTEPWYFFKNNGYHYRYAGENLARDFADPNSAVSAWMASPTHRDNLLSDKYVEIGIGVVEGDLGGIETTIIVQFFGTKLVDTLPSAPVAAVQTKEESPPPLSEVELASEENQGGAEKVASQLQEENEQPQVLTSPLNVNRRVSLGVIAFLVSAFIVDLLVISRKKIVRISGKNLAHISFLGMVLAIVLVAKAGKIL